MGCSVGVAEDLTTDQVLSVKSPFIELSDDRGFVVDKIRRSWVQHFVSVTQRLAPVYRLYLPKLVIVKQSEPNALVEVRKLETLLVVNADMLRLVGDDEDLMAVVVGHELAHLRLGQWRHGHAGPSIPSVVSLSAGSAADDRMERPGRDSRRADPRLGTHKAPLATVKFSEQQEHEADALSIRNMVNAGFDPAAAPRFWRMLQEKGGGLWLTEHPINDARLHAMQSLASSLAEIYAANKPVRAPAGSEVVAFGARLSDMPPMAIGLEGVSGVLVAAVSPKSAAAAAGIATGDILLRVDGRPIDKPDDVQRAVAEAARGSIVEIKLMRKAVPVWVRVQL